MATTFIAALVLHSFTTTLFNHQFGLFLMLCMSLSWAFATFFLLPLLSAVGPEGDFDLCPGWISIPARWRAFRVRRPVGKDAGSGDSQPQQSQVLPRAQKQAVASDVDALPASTQTV